MVETENSITSMLLAYEQQENRRALGGIYALAGFDYQLRFYLADFIESLVNQGNDLNTAGHVFFEALSDVANKDENNNLICIQVKRSLTPAALKDAALEIVAIDRFLSNHYPSIQDQVKFNLVASQGSAEIKWANISKTHETRAIIDQLLEKGRLLPIRIESDPWWRAITVVWPHLKDPYGFLRFALEKTINRQPIAADARRIRDDICDRFKRDQLTKVLPGQLLTPEDFLFKDNPSKHLEVGREITLARFRDRQYIRLTKRLDVLYTNIFEYKDMNPRKLRGDVPVFWLNGRSGAGKSVLLVQTLERLVLEGWRVLWLKGNTDLLEPTLLAIKEAHENDRPDFIAIDDLYDRDARNLIDLSSLGEFIDQSDHSDWPVILTCGPTEFADSFEDDATYRGFNLHRYSISPLEACEAREIEAWYQQRTGKSAQRGTAYTQAAEEDNGLFISLALELEHGDIKTFAKRFAQRVELNGLNKALVLPLALNRLYLRAPYDWLTKEDREILATLNHEGDFNLLETAEEGQIIRLTHPHLANALYIALRKPANNEAYTNDLADAFKRALNEHNTNLASQLLRLFSGREQGIATERLNIVKLPYLAMECAKHWNDYLPLALNPDDLADMTTSWACWVTTAPNITSVFSINMFSAALDSLGSALKAWSICWQHLLKYYPDNEELFLWAKEHLPNQLFIKHPTWSFVWELCLENNPAHITSWNSLGLDWLQRSLRRPDWHIVWKKLLPVDNYDIERDPVFILGRRRLYAEMDGPDWAFVLQDLLYLVEPHSYTFTELINLGKVWLLDREHRAEWTFVWRALLDHCYKAPGNLPLPELLGHGGAWLNGREDRAEWTHVWRALLEQKDELPLSLPISKLIERGAAWLSGHEDRFQWTHVWRALLEQRNEFSESLALYELIKRGASWLNGHEDRSEWTHVWRTLLDLRDELPANLTVYELIERGAVWMNDREDRPEWTYVWRALIDLKQELPESLPLSELIELGVAWLNGRDDLVEWAYVWRGLIENRNVFPDTVSLSKLLQHGTNWLNGRDDWAEWTYVWQDLIKLQEDLPENLLLSELLEQGGAWLPGRENYAGWAFVWRTLLDQQDVLPKSLNISTLLQRGATWLREREDGTEEWSYVLELLLEQKYHNDEFFKTAANWLINAIEKPEWPILAAKFIVATPHHSASKKMAAILVKRIQAEPNKGHWYKTEKLIVELAEKDTLPLEVKDWLHALIKRKQHPAWEDAQRRLNEGLPIKGFFVLQKGMAAPIITLENGLTAIFPESKLTKNGFYDFYVLNINIDRDMIRVGMNKASQLITGETYSGIAKEYTQYGLFVTIDNQTGLLHKTQCSNWIDLIQKHPKGSNILVTVLELSSKGPKLHYAGPELDKRMTEKALIGSEASRARGNENKACHIKKGEEYAGIVRALKDYGLFVTIENQTGLLHKTQCSNWIDLTKKHPKGSKIYVRVLEMDSKGPKLQYSGPELDKLTSEEHLRVGEIYRARISGIKAYGVFLRFGSFSGLIHRTELPQQSNIMRNYSTGQELDVQLVAINDDGKLVFKLPK